MRLIDADVLQEEFEWLESNVYECGRDSVQDALERIKRAPTINPETLPIVRELREELDNERKICDDLQRELVQVAKERYEARRDCAVAESNHSECLAQLAKARVQLKSAITDMEALMWHSGDGCNICKHCVEVHREPYVRLDCDLGSGCECKPEWRGPDGDRS